MCLLNLICIIHNQMMKLFPFNFVLLFRKLNTLYECTGYPTVDCGDLYTECQGWATTDNYCRVNYVDWMKVNCCYSCQKATSCQDGYDSCGSWASSGFCKGDYEVFMSENCCQSCASMCQDDNASCGSWASSGFCKGDYEVFMSENCCQSCASMCQDVNALCGSWASSGFCQGVAEVYMSENCKKSCGIC